MAPLVECIPNFSDGHDPAIRDAIASAIRAVPRAWVLDQTSDTDHHRSVITFAGEPEAVLEAAFQAIRIATDRIDLRRHQGVHPRIGATDVVPFIPLRDATMEDCVRLARRLGERVGRDLHIPVFLYEEAASHPDRTRLESVRRGGVDGLRARMAHDPAWHPDFGPPQLHETAGAIVIGARQPLIAFNVNLNSGDLDVAKAIARTIRQSGGGLPCVKAIGVALASRRIVQVSMNLTDYRVTSMASAFQAVQTEATKRGVAVAGSELIGLVPQAAWDQAAALLLRLDRFDPSSVLETRLAQTMAAGTIPEIPHLETFLRAVAAPTPTPAGGSVAALTGALAAALGTMGARLGKDPAAEQRLTEASRTLHGLIEADGAAYAAFTHARKRPNDQADRLAQIAAALQRSTDIPLEIAELACDAGQTIATLRSRVSIPVQSDLTVGLILALAAAEAALHTAETNMKLQKNQLFTTASRERSSKIRNCLDELRGLCYTPPSVA